MREFHGDIERSMRSRRSHARGNAATAAAAIETRKAATSRLMYILIGVGSAVHLERDLGAAMRRPARNRSSPKGPPILPAPLLPGRRRG